MAAQRPSERYPLIQYLKLEAGYVEAIDSSLRDGARQLSRDINRLSSGSHPLTRMQMEAQRAAIHSYINTEWASIQTGTILGQRAAAQEAARVVGRYESLLLSTVLAPDAIETYVAGAAQRAAASINLVLARQANYIPLSSTVYKAKQLSNGQLDRLINSALARGLNARSLAREVKAFISPDVPGGLPYAAKRVARTEINNAFHATQTQRYIDSGIVEAVDWHLSGSHPQPDECNDYADQSPFDVNRVPAKPHPNCLCYTTPSLPSKNDFISNLMAGKYGDEPWYGDVDLSGI